MSKRKVGPRGDAAMGARIAAARQAKGWSQAKAAEEIGVSKAAVSKWETGDRMPLAGALRKISDVLGVSMDELAKGARQMTAQEIADMNECLNKKDREQHEPTVDEVGDYPDYPYERYDR